MLKPRSESNESGITQDASRSLQFGEEMSDKTHPPAIGTAHDADVIGLGDHGVLSHLAVLGDVTLSAHG